jgi:hypothetical protein
MLWRCPPSRGGAGHLREDPKGDVLLHMLDNENIDRNVWHTQLWLWRASRIYEPTRSVKEIQQEHVHGEVTGLWWWCIPHAYMHVLSAGKRRRLVTRRAKARYTSTEQLQDKPRTCMLGQEDEQWTGGRQVHGRCCALPGLMISQLHPGCFFAWPLTQQKDGRLTHRCLFVPGMFLPPKQSRASVPAIMISRKRTGGTATC